MKPIYKTGDLTEASERIIAHGCNTQGVMGSGVAKAIRGKWPQNYEWYRSAYQAGGLVLGTIVWYAITHDGKEELLIANCITQEFFGRDGKQYVDYDAVRRCMWGINKESRLRREQHMNPYDQNPFDSFALPMIGAGLGGDWSIIESIIDAETTDVQPVVYTL